MSHAAYSISYGVELDARQLLMRRGVIFSVEAEDFGLPPAGRTWMQSDLLCPSCRCADVWLTCGISCLRQESHDCSWRNADITSHQHDS